MPRGKKTTENLEASMEELDGLVAKLEGEDLSLEEAFRLYSEGMRLLKKCGDSIDKIEKKVLLLEEGPEEWTETEQ